MSKTKNKRLATINFANSSKEWIEIDDNGIFYWKADDNISDVVMSCITSFLVDLEFVKDFFARADREFDVTKLPSNYVSNPYSHWI